jgi:hypothetical protein
MSKGMTIELKRISVRDAVYVPKQITGTISAITEVLENCSRL